MRRALSMFPKKAAQPFMLGTTPSSLPYPFSKTAKTADPTTPVPATLLNGTALMAHLRETIPTGYSRELLAGYFNPRSPDQITPGSVVSVTFDGGSFAGVLISVRHKGVDTSFTLRNVIQRTGVEMRFTVGSPMIKEVKVISRAGGNGPRDGKRMRRAKLFYLRDQPSKMSTISAAVKKSS
jgi:large subunit ribosomal protein L19